MGSAIVIVGGSAEDEGVTLHQPNPCRHEIEEVRLDIVVICTDRVTKCTEGRQKMWKEKGNEKKEKKRKQRGGR